MAEKKYIDTSPVILDLTAMKREFDAISLDGIIKALKEAPAADVVEVVHAEWVMKETMVRSPFAKNAYCSVCYEETSYPYNYCPHCGAKMDGWKDETD